MISETQSNFWWGARPTYENTIFTNEQNDIYIMSPGFYGFNPNHKKSGFLCIPNGKTEFEPSKTWDISNTNIEGSEYKPASVVNTKYIGNGKVAGFVSIQELFGSNPFASKNCMAVIMDMNAKTIKKVEGVPLTEGTSVGIEFHNGKVVFSAYGKDQAGFFTYDVETKKATHDVITAGQAVFIHFFE